MNRVSFRLLAATTALAAPLFAAGSAGADFYQQTNLITDDSAFLAGQGYTPTSNPDDPDLINPWGISYGPGGPFWVSDNNSGLATLYNGSGAKLGLTVTLSGAGGVPGASNPTGQVFNGTSDFSLAAGGKATFLFASEDGTIAGWNGGGGAQIAVDNSASGAVYKGIALGTVGGYNFVYATNFNSGKVDVFNSSFAPAAGFSFTDPSPPPLPAGTPAGQNWAPFNVQELNGELYVITYALQDSAKHDDVAGAGNGFVDEFNMDGTFVRRIATGGALDSPWGLDIAPSSWGQFANDLLVGNFGNGTINVFDPNATDDFLGTLDDANGNPIVLGDLWGIINGNGGSGGDPNSVYFTAGLVDEAHGLFGELSVPEPGTLMLFGAGLVGLARLRRARSV